MKPCKIIMILVFVLIVQGCQFETIHLAEGQRMEPSLHKAIKMGRRFFEKEEIIFPFEEVDVSVYNEIEAWQERKKFGPKMLEDTITKLHRAGKEYWMIEYMPKKMVFGGVGVVFIDRNTREIIDWYGEE